MSRRRRPRSAAGYPGRGETIYTAGHSTRSGEELVALLSDAGVGALADVRRFPASRRHPQHNRGELSETLAAAEIRYVWLGDELGGRRGPTLPADQSPNRAWTVPAFRHYADAMPAPAFQSAFARLEALARETPTAVMCAERLWWRCHRRLLADLLRVRGWRVVHLLDPGKSSEHALSEWARVEGGVLSYPALL